MINKRDGKQTWFTKLNNRLENEEIERQVMIRELKVGKLKFGTSFAHLLKKEMPFFKDTSDIEINEIKAQEGRVS